MKKSQQHGKQFHVKILIPIKMAAYSASSVSKKILKWLCLPQRNSEGWIYLITFKTHEQQWQYCTEFLLDRKLSWIFLRQQVNYILSPLNVKYTVMQRTKLPYNLQNWYSVMGIPNHWISAYIFFLLQGSLPVYLRRICIVLCCILSELWESEDSVHHNNHFLIHPIQPKAQWATACTCFILWNNCNSQETDSKIILEGQCLFRHSMDLWHCVFICAIYELHSSMLTLTWHYKKWWRCSSHPVKNQIPSYLSQISCYKNMGAEFTGPKWAHWIMWTRSSFWTKASTRFFKKWDPHTHSVDLILP